MNRWRVLLGSIYNKPVNANVAEVKTIVYHSSYLPFVNADIDDNSRDIAVLALTQPLTFNGRIHQGTHTHIINIIRIWVRERERETHKHTKIKRWLVSSVLLMASKTRKSTSNKQTQKLNYRQNNTIHNSLIINFMFFISSLCHKYQRCNIKQEKLFIVQEAFHQILPDT